MIFCRCVPKGVDHIDLDEVSYDLFFHRYLSGRCPVVLHGFNADWSGLSHWTRESLVHLVGKNEITFLDQAEMTHPYGIDYRTFHQYAQKRPSLYGKIDFEWPRDWPKLPQFHHNYLDAVHPDGNYCRIYVGNAGTFTALHADTCDTSIVQVQGVKRVVLFPPGPSQYFLFIHCYSVNSD